MKKRSYGKNGYIRFHTFENEEHVKCSNLEALKRWIDEYSGYDSENDFVQSTGVQLEEIVDKWFFIVHNYVYIH